MLSHPPSITLSFAVEEPTAIGSYALIAASHPVSVQKDLVDSQTIRPSNHVASPSYLRNSAPSNLKGLSKSRSEKAKLPQVHKNQSSLGLSLRLQDTFRNYVRHHIPNQISYPQTAVRHRPSRELRQLFANHEEATNRCDREEANSIFNKMRNLTELRQAYCQS